MSKVSDRLDFHHGSEANDNGTLRQTQTLHLRPLFAPVAALALPPRPSFRSRTALNLSV